MVTSISKHRLSAALKRKCLNLNEKIVILDYANERRKIVCRKFAEYFSVGKAAFSGIYVKDCKYVNYAKAISKTLRDYKFFQMKLQKASTWKVFCNQWNFVQMVQKMHKCKCILMPDGRPHLQFFKNCKNYSDCVQLWVKFSIQNVISRASRRKKPRMYLLNNCSVI